MSHATFNIVEVFIKAAQAQPDTLALKQDKKQTTYRSLLSDVQHTAAAFLEKGVRPGDKVLVFVPVSPDLYRIVLALFYIGASPVFLDAWVSFRRLRACCEAVPCQAIIVARRLLWLVRLINPLRSIPIKLHPGIALPVAQQIVPPFATQPQNTALVTFTTGSTGTPKAADRTHAYLAAQLKALAPLIPEDSCTIVSTLPIVVLINLALGKATVLPPRKYKIKKSRSAAHLAAAIQEEHADTMIVSPATISQFTGFSLPSIKYIITGGGPVFPQIAAQVRESFSQADATIVFGSTEAEPVSHLKADVIARTSPDTLFTLGLPVGFPDSNALVSIIPFSYQPVNGHTWEEWERLRCKDSVAGEIVVSGGHVLKHYINNPAAEAVNKIQVAGNTWHRTGDAGRIGDDGMIYFLGRCSEAILHNGKHLFPAIITYRFCSLTGAKNAALIEIKQKLTLVLEKPSILKQEELKCAMKQCGISAATIVYVKHIPKDPRHQTKTDYEHLYRMLTAHFSSS